MATLKPSTLSSWLLTPHEETLGAILNSLNKCVIQNQICLIAEEKLALVYDPLNPNAFQQREAELQGQLGILRYLLACSEEAENKLNTQSTNSLEN